jgi:hypothetical protein
MPAASAPLKRARGKARMMDVWSLGYSGHDTASFLAVLRGAGVRQVADVRERPASRKPGFSRKALEASLGKAGIGYANLPQLGAPEDIRDPYHATGDVRAFHQAYAVHLDGERAALDGLARLAREAPTAILCVERDPRECHRAVLEARLRRRGFAVHHLPPLAATPSGKEGKRPRHRMALATKATARRGGSPRTAQRPKGKGRRGRDVQGRARTAKGSAGSGQGKAKS